MTSRQLLSISLNTTTPPPASMFFTLSLYLDVITQLFSYRPIYQARASITAQGVAEGSFDRWLDIDDNIKTTVT